MAASMNIERDPNRVYYRAGGFEQSRPILHGPDAKETFEFIPTVDMANISSSDLELRKKLAAEVGQAMREVGFFYAINPPVDTKLMDEMLELYKKFFALPFETKTKYHMNQSPSFKGYMPSKTMENNAPDRDTFSVGSDFTDLGQHFIKVAPPGAVSQN